MAARGLEDGGCIEKNGDWELEDVSDLRNLKLHTHIRNSVQAAGNDHNTWMIYSRWNDEQIKFWQYASYNLVRELLYLPVSYKNPTNSNTRTIVLSTKPKERRLIVF
jgi:hypothetical protein